MTKKLGSLNFWYRHRIFAFVFQFNECGVYGPTASGTFRILARINLINSQISILKINELRVKPI